MVVLKPLDWKALLIKLDSILLAGLLHSHVPDSVLEVRTNYMRNFLALNARNLEPTKALVKIMKLLGIPVRSYNPFSRNPAPGVVHGVTHVISNTDLEKKCYPI